MPSKVCGLHSILYLLQSEVLPPEELILLLPLATDYLHAHLQDSSSPLGQCDMHTSGVWTLAFYVLENFEHELKDKTWAPNTVQLALSLAGQTATPHGTYLLLLGGLERLAVGGKLAGPALAQAVKLATDLLTETNPALTIPAVQLFLAGMYASSSVDVSTSVGGIDDPEELMQAMERMSILLDCVRRSGRREARLLCREVLPRVLVDFFPAADVVNRVISTFLSPGQPHQVLLAGVLFRVFCQAARQDQSAMLQEWVLMALPNFTKRYVNVGREYEKYMLYIRKSLMF